jgi:hypothetical protein
MYEYTVCMSTRFARGTGAVSYSWSLRAVPATLISDLL